MSMPLYIQQADGTLLHVPTGAGVSERSLVLFWVLFVAAHIALALGMRQVPVLSTVHALVILIAGMWWAVSENKLLQVMYVGAYLTGAEVLWRMTAAQVPWEFCKYATGLIFILALMRNGRLRLPLLPTLYFALLLPAIITTAVSYYLPLDSVRQMLSSNLSGPFALVASAWFFSHVKLNSSQLESLFLSIIGPTVGIATIALTSTVTTEHMRWGTQSNFVSSGGFGPNQVSGALGLGALMAFLLLLRSRSGTGLKVFVFITMALLVVQSALTFSRGGLIGALGASLVSAFYLIRKRKSRAKLLLIIALILLAAFLVLPTLDSITNGALSKRFENTSTTGRVEIAQSDLQMWDRNPVFGVGVGMSLFRDKEWRAAHTEFTRMLAEHGLFGLASLILLLVAGWRRLQKTSTTEGKALIGAMLGWSVLFMLDKAMRLVAPSFMFGVAFVTLQPEPQEQRNITYRIVSIPQHVSESAPGSAT